jgi:hypothetical protein
MWRWLLALVTLAFVGCGEPKQVSIDGFEVLTASGLSAESASEWQLPSHLTLLAEVDNQGSKVRLSDCRLRVSYRGRRVLMLWTEQKVSLPARSRSRIVVPLRLAIARNSQSLPLQQALSRRDLSEVTLDWECKASRGIAAGRIEQSGVAASEVLSAQQQEQLWKMLE